MFHRGTGGSGHRVLEEEPGRLEGARDTGIVGPCEQAGQGLLLIPVSPEHADVTAVHQAGVDGFVLGIFESFVEVFYGVAWAQPGVFLLIIVMLIVRPNGLFGIGEVRRL